MAQARDSFLTVVERELGSDGSGAAGDEFGGASGKTGQGMPTTNPGNFLFATGVECSYPTIKNGAVRRDQLEECGHYKYWREDLHLVQEMGIRALRYGLPYHKIHLGPGKYDWDFSDAVMREMQALGIAPILDLMHFGVPDWVGNFQNPELPLLFADYAEQVALRYPWVRAYTPVNEIYVTAKHSRPRRHLERAVEVRSSVRNGAQALRRRLHFRHAAYRQAPLRRALSSKVNQRNTSTTAAPNRAPTSR